MLVLKLFFVYIFLHFFLYLYWFRNTAAFLLERIIFLYHACSFLLTFIFFTILMYINVDFELFILILSIHGIYSLSFLEFWSLSQCGYSLHVLSYIALG